jgi:Integrase zinc binding domain
LAKWVLDIQALGFVVLHAAGNGELMSVPDALSRDFVEDSVLCERCLEVAAVVDEEGTASTEDESEMRATQVAEFGDLNIAKLKAPGLLLNEKGILCKLTRKTVHVVVPNSLREKMLAKVHGSRSLGHWGVVRSTIAMSRRYWWDGWLKDVEEYVKKCLACVMAKLGSSGRRQSRMVRYTLARRFEIVALDITQITPSGRNGEQKVLVIGDVKSRFIVAVPWKDEHADTLSTILCGAVVCSIRPA